MSNPWSVYTSSTHDSPHIPHQQPFIPTDTRTPPFGTEQTPIHPHHKLGVLPHPPQFPPSSKRHRIPSSLQVRQTLLLLTIDPQSTPIRPNPTSHIIARAQQHIAQVRAPCHFPDRILMAREHGHGPLSGVADVEDADEAVDACGCDELGAVLVPVVGQDFRRGNMLEGDIRLGFGGYRLGMQGNGSGEVV